MSLIVDLIKISFNGWKNKLYVLFPCFGKQKHPKGWDNFGNLICYWKVPQTHFYNFPIQNNGVLYKTFIFLFSIKHKRLRFFYRYVKSKTFMGKLSLCRNDKYRTPQSEFEKCFLNAKSFSRLFSRPKGIGEKMVNLRIRYFIYKLFVEKQVW